MFLKKQQLEKKPSLLADQEGSLAKLDKASVYGEVFETQEPFRDCWFKYSQSRFFILLIIHHHPPNGSKREKP